MKKFSDVVTTASLTLIVCGPDQLKDAQGVHLFEPDLWYLNDAIVVAERDMFSTIYLHYPTRGARYIIPNDVLAALLDYQSSFESLAVKITDPSSPDGFASNQLRLAK